MQATIDSLWIAIQVLQRQEKDLKILLLVIFITLISLWIGYVLITLFKKTEL